MVNLAMNTYMKSKFIENREGGDLPWSFRGNAKILLLISDTCCYFGDQKLSGGPRLLVAESWGGEGSPGTTGFEGGAHGDCGFERERSGGDGGGGGYMGIYNERKFRPAPAILIFFVAAPKDFAFNPASLYKFIQYTK